MHTRLVTLDIYWTKPLETVLDFMNSEEDCFKAGPCGDGVIHVNVLKLIVSISEAVCHTPQKWKM